MQIWNFPGPPVACIYSSTNIWKIWKAPKQELLGQKVPLNCSTALLQKFQVKIFQVQYILLSQNSFQLYTIKVWSVKMVSLIYFCTLRKWSAILGLHFSVWCWLPRRATVPWRSQNIENNWKWEFWSYPANNHYWDNWNLLSEACHSLPWLVYSCLLYTSPSPRD